MYVLRGGILSSSSSDFSHSVFSSTGSAAAPASGIFSGPGGGGTAKTSTAATAGGLADILDVSNMPSSVSSNISSSAVAAGFAAAAAAALAASSSYHTIMKRLTQFLPVHLSRTLISNRSTQVI